MKTNNDYKWTYVDGRAIPPLKRKPLPEHRSNRWAGCTTCDKDGLYGPSHSGSSMCRNGTSLAAGGHVTHCTCAACF